MSGTLAFTINATAGLARAGQLDTPHGTIHTPVFMPVGTRASVKALAPYDVLAAGADIILGNTYHLYLKPGTNVMDTYGGLHQFMRWPKPILTDSGGYQVSSLGHFKAKGSKKLTSIDEEGVTFRSHIDGSTHRLTPEKAIQIQASLGSDIMMAFDEATPDKGYHYAKAAMERTHRWLDRCINAWEESEQSREATGLPSQALFGIIQGGDFEELRHISADYVTSKKLPGVAIGGASIGQSPEETHKNIQWVIDRIDRSKPLYAMGVGVDPTHAIEAIKSGADMFDCVAPTKLARTGILYTGRLDLSRGIDQAMMSSPDERNRINIGKHEYAMSHDIVESTCDCYTCTQGFSRGYLHHLYKVKELLYYRLASIHNIRMMIRTVALMRQAILDQSNT